MQKNTYELSVKGLKNLRKDIDKIKNILKSKAFLEFIANKCVQYIKYICSVKLTDNALSNDDVSAYMQNHKYSIHGNTITLYNDSQIDVASKTWMSPEKLSNYKAELSLGKIIEFGIGYIGGMGSYSYVDSDWQYDVNNHGSEGWYYQNNNGTTIWTNGYMGKQIYATLMDNLDSLMPKWVDEYIKKNL